MNGNPVSSFPPVADANARILLLGSMPGEASLRAGQYYAHPHNQFWTILAGIIGFPAGAPYAERCTRVRQAGIAIWDVLQSCVRPGSLDASIDPHSIIPNDIGELLRQCPQIRLIGFNGGMAETVFRRHIRPRLTLSGSITCIRLPSTSPAHASLRPAAKLQQWRDRLESSLIR